MTMLAAHNFAKIIKTGTREEKNTITEKKYIIKQYKFTHTLVCFNILVLQSNPAISKPQGKWKTVRNSGVLK